MVSRLRRGWSMVQVGWLVVTDHPKLLAPPILSAAVLVALASMIGPQLLLGSRPGDVQNSLGPALPLVIGLAVKVIMVFFDVVLVFCALPCFRGQEPSVRESLAAAWSSRSSQILGWALAASAAAVLVGWLDASLGGSHGPFGSLPRLCIELAWAAATFFVVPVLVVEGLGPVEALRRSSEVLRERWVEALGGLAGITLLGFVLTLPGIVLAILAGGPSGGALWGLVALYLVGGAALLTAVLTIFQTGVYLFSVQGGRP